MFIVRSVGLVGARNVKSKSHPRFVYARCHCAVVDFLSIKDYRFHPFSFPTRSPPRRAAPRPLPSPLSPSALLVKGHLRNPFYGIVARRRGSRSFARCLADALLFSLSQLRLSRFTSSSPLIHFGQGHARVASPSRGSRLTPMQLARLGTSLYAREPQNDRHFSSIEGRFYYFFREK